MIELFLAASLHLSGGNYNPIHPYIQYSRENYAVGVFYNSMRRPSFYLTHRHDYDKIFVEYGISTGYVHKVTPIGRVGYKVHKRVNVFIAPGFDLNRGMTGMLAVEVRLY